MHDAENRGSEKEKRDPQKWSLGGIRASGREREKERTRDAKHTSLIH